MKKALKIAGEILLIVLGIWVYCSAIINIMSKEGDHMDIVQTFLKAIGLSEGSITLLMLILIAVILIVFVLAKFGKIHRFLQENVGEADRGHGAVNQGIDETINKISDVQQQLQPVKYLNSVQTNAHTAASGIQDTNRMLREIYTNIQVIGNQAQTIQNLQVAHPDASAAFQNVQAMYFVLAESNDRLQKENKRLQEELEQCKEELNQCKEQIRQAEQQEEQEEDMRIPDEWER